MAFAPKMQPEWSDGKVEKPRFLSVLLLGAIRIGKTSVAVGTTPGPVYVINSDGRDGLTPVKRHHPNVKFGSNLVQSIAGMEEALVTARALVDEGKVKTIVWDTMSNFAEYLEVECAKKTQNAAGEPDGRRYWPAYTKYLVQTCARLMKIDAHIVVCSHYIDTGTSDLEGAPKVGPGLVPLLAKSARMLVGKEFSDIIFMEKDKKGLRQERVFRTGLEGIWGPGCRNVEGNETCDANFADFMRLAGFTGTTSKLGLVKK